MFKIPLGIICIILYWFQGACRYARQFELRMEEEHKRVEFLEDLIGIDLLKSYNQWLR